jgi:hypothetical protein
MKNFKLSRALAIVGIGLASMTACTDLCKDVNCNFGTCVEGDCVCQAGYSGTNCATEIRAAYLGTFNITETCTSGSDSYAVVVSAGTSINSIVINNLYDAGFAVTGTLNTAGGVDFSGTFGTGTISGTMTTTGGQITVTFTVTAGGATDTCTATS